MEPQEEEGVEFWNCIALEFDWLGNAYRLDKIDVRDWVASSGVKQNMSYCTLLRYQNIVLYYHISPCHMSLLFILGVCLP